MPPFIDLTGKTFNRLTVLERAKNKHGESSKWKCQCICGKKFITRGFAIRSGKTKSCGCLNKELSVIANTIHGMWKTHEYHTWQSMIQRCYNPKNPKFKRYGARNISICKKWKNDFKIFFNDMGKCPPSFTIERIDNDGNYEPSNCKWASAKEQANNTSRNALVTINSWTLNITQWATYVGLNARTIRTRLRLGWPIEKAIFKPVRYHKPYS